MNKYNVAIVGATGLVGETFVKILEERKFPVAKLHPLASESSKGKKVKFLGKDISVQCLDKNSFVGIDFALFSAGGDVSLEYAPIAAKAGAIVIDNSSAFRMEKDVPLIVPEVNGYIIHNGEPDFLLSPPRSIGGSPASKQTKVCFPKKGRIISNPNCSTIQLVCVLKPLHDVAKIKRVVVSTYQSVSGAGREALEELQEQTGKSLRAADGGEAISFANCVIGIASSQAPRNDKTVFPHPIAFNCIPHIDKFEPNGYTKEEMKVVNETKKIMGDDSIAVTCTAVRVPVKVGHSEAVNIETERKLSNDEARKILSNAPGIKVIDDPMNAKYPLAINAEGRDEVFVGRIREDVSIKNGLSFWIVADNIRKGAALNAVQIAEMMIK